MDENNNSNGANNLINKKTIVIAATVAVAMALILGISIYIKSTTLIAPQASAV